MLHEPWRIAMFGGLSVRQTARTINRFHTAKTGMLLAYLAFYLKRDHPREVLCELLWPESEPEAARTNLRVALNSLRNQLEPPGVQSGAVVIADRTNVRLNRETVTTDVSEFEAAVQAAGRIADPAERLRQLTTAVELYTGDILPAFYADWVIAERLRLSEIYLTAVGDLVVALEQAGDANRAIDYARRAIAVDPSREDMHYNLMRLYVAAGRAGDAHRQYQTLEHVLHKEYGDRPSAATSALLERVERVERVEVGHQNRDLDNRGVPPPLPPDPNIGTPPVFRGPSEFGNPLPISPPPLPITRIPLQFTRFFGREEEIAHLVEAFQDEGSRLVTLTGLGGSGKTRVAIELARRAAEWLEGAVWFVALGDLTDPSQILEAVAAALSIEARPNVNVLAQISSRLSGRPCLLILDNFEHLLEEGADVVHLLRSQIPSLTCLVTSRQRLGLQGEKEIPVHPLATPANPGTPERLLEFASVQIFVDRAQLARPDFQITPRNSSAIAGICTRLEGIPLAIELAAAWSQAHTPAQILGKLDQRFEILESRHRDYPARHRTLRVAVDWSYQLLPPVLRQFFTRLSVFRGGWTLEAAEAVCGDRRAFQHLAELQARSLIRAEEVGEEMRYAMLETLREFAFEQFSEEALPEAQRRHADYCASIAADFARGMLGGQQAEWLDRLEQEYDNIRAALRWSNGCAPDIAIRTASEIWLFWYRRGYLPEGRHFLANAIAHAPNIEVAYHAKSLMRSGVLACAAGDYSTARKLHEESLTLFKLLQDRCGIAAVLNNVGIVARHIGDYATARQAYEQSVMIYRQLDLHGPLATTLSNLGSICFELGEIEQARSLLHEAVEFYRILDDPRSMAVTLHNLGELAYTMGDAESQRYFEDSLALRRDHGDRSDITVSLASLALIAKDRGDFERAARLMGAVAAGREAMGTPLPPSDRLQIEALVSTLRAGLTSSTYSSIWSEGSTLTLEQAIEYALGPKAVSLSAH